MFSFSIHTRNTEEAWQPNAHQAAYICPLWWLLLFFNWLHHCRGKKWNNSEIDKKHHCLFSLQQKTEALLGLSDSMGSPHSIVFELFCNSVSWRTLITTQVILIRRNANWLSQLRQTWSLLPYGYYPNLHDLSQLISAVLTAYIFVCSFLSPLN